MMRSRKPASRSGIPKPYLIRVDKELSEMKLENKVAVITGAASGIGKEIARTFAQAGATVVIADRNVAAAQEADKELGSSGPRTLAVAMDVTSESDVESGIADVIATYGRLDVLVS